MYKILKNTIEMDDYSVQKLSKSQPPVPFEWNTVEGTELNVSDCIGGKGKIGIKRNTYQATSILPDGYTQVDYIESHGNEYIDTGVNADSNLRAFLDMAFTNPTGSNQNVGVIYKEDNLYKRYHLICQAGRIKLNFYGGVIDLCDADSDRHVFDLDVPNQSIKADKIEYLISKQDFDCELDFRLFGRNSNIDSLAYLSLMKLWRSKMYVSGVLVRDFIPCYRNSDNEVGLYDIVNNVFYTNQGTGAFTYGATVTVPNPDFEIPIEVVTGNNVVKHVGKNWFNSEMEKGDISYTTGNNTSSSNRVRTNDFMPVFPNETYILKRYSFTGKQLGLRLYDQNQNYLGYKSAATTETITFATNEYTTADGTFSGEIYYIKLIDLENDLNATYQLELGSTATDYEPYKEENYNINLGNIELCKIGDYEDEVFKNVVGDENYNADLEVGAWYKKKVFDKEILDNNTVINSVEQSTGNPDYTYVYSNILDNKVKFNANTLFMCDCFRTHTGQMIKSTQVNTDSINISNSDKYALLRFMILTSRLTGQTNAAVKAFFNSIKPVLYYELREPVYEKITDPTLISQLEALNKFKWFKGVNHIWTETDNLEPVLKGTYRQAINE